MNKLKQKLVKLMLKLDERSLLTESIYYLPSSIKVKFYLAVEIDKEEIVGVYLDKMNAFNDATPNIYITKIKSPISRVYSFLIPYKHLIHD